MIKRPNFRIPHNLFELREKSKLQNILHVLSNMSGRTILTNFVLKFSWLLNYQVVSQFPKKSPESQPQKYRKKQKFNEKNPKKKKRKNRNKLKSNNYIEKLFN